MTNEEDFPIMPFGKHKDKPINEIPKGYLVWLKNNVRLFGEVKQAVECRLNDVGYSKILTIDEKLDKLMSQRKPFIPSDG
jgi:hypothetical protein